MTDWTWNFRHILSFVLQGKQINEIFFSELSSQLAIDFESKIGLNPLYLKKFIHLSLKAALNYPFEYDEEKSLGEMDVMLGVDICAFYPKIKWKSNSRKLYKPTSFEIDPKDIHFWFEGLDKNKILEIWNDPAYNPKTLGFKHKKTHFNLEVEYFHYDAFYMVISLKELAQNNIYLTEISDEISIIFEKHNIKSESKNRRYGLVHDYGAEVIKNNKLIYYIDYGSANEKPLKDVIDKLNTFESIEKVLFTGQKE